MKLPSAQCDRANFNEREEEHKGLLCVVLRSLRRNGSIGLAGTEMCGRVASLFGLVFANEAALCLLTILCLKEERSGLQGLERAPFCVVRRTPKEPSTRSVAARSH